MANKKSRAKARLRGDSGCIDPAKAYSLDGAALALGMSRRWVMDNLIANDAVPHFRRGDFVGIPGRVLVAWIESDLRAHSEWRATKSRD